MYTGRDLGQAQDNTTLPQYHTVHPVYTMDARYAGSEAEIVSHNSTMFKSKSSNNRYVIGIACLVVLLLGAIAAPVAVAVSKSSDDDSPTSGASLLLPSCVVNPGSSDEHLDAANCVLDSYPLIDG
jgi:hypothetical protein